MAGESAAVLELLSVAEQAAGSPQSGLMFRLQLLRARALRGMGRYDEGLAVCAQALSMSPGTIALPEQRMMLRIVEGATLWQVNRVDESVEKLLGIRSELLTGPDSRLLALCTLELSSAEIFRGALRSARTYVMEAIVSSRRVGNSFVEAMALDNLARIDKFACRWAAAEESVKAAIAIHEQHGYRLQAHIARRAYAIIAWKRGRLPEALGIANDGCSEASSLGYRVQEWFSALLKGMVLLHLGRFTEAHAALTAEESWGIPIAQSRTSLLNCEFLGDLEMEQGNTATAQRLYEQAWSMAIALVPHGDIVAELRRRRAECRLLTGEPHAAYNEALAGIEHCRRLGDRYEEAATYRVLAEAAAALDRQDEAKSWFELGFAFFDDIETPYEWGKLWLSYGDWLSTPRGGARRDLKAAIEAYRAAEDYFHQIGSEFRRAQAVKRRVALGRVLSGTVAPELDDALEAPSPGLAPRRLRRPRGLAELRSRGEWALDTFKIVTRSKLVLDLLSEVEKLAISQTPILVLGESGTGKELIAEGAHRLSGRSGRFMAINCGAIPRDMVESELFGHVAGAFTGATKDKVGLLETCVGGTAFLDEIGEMAPDLQSKLLRFLESGEVRQVGSNRKVIADTLIIAATNRDRASLEAGDRFRTDLYYRLAHAVIVLPPLRKRGDDIDLLVSHFLAQFCGEYKKQVRLTDAARNRLIAYSWPGNVRQLKAALRRVVVLATESQPVGPEALDLNEAEVPATLSQELEQAEKRRIIEAIAQSRGVRAEAARILGMSRTTMLGKMKRYGIH
jgi:tetratricopeptide (TPR) repeat protein